MSFALKLLSATSPNIMSAIVISAFNKVKLNLSWDPFYLSCGNVER